jgi:uncharacterized protein
MSLFYNVLMLFVDTAALALLRRRPGPGRAAAGFLLAGLAGVLLAALLGTRFFGTALLLAYGVFLHGFLVLAGSAALLWRPRRRAALPFLAAAGLVGGVAVHAFLIEPYWLELTRVRIVSPKLERPVRIAVLADLQTDRIGAYEREVLQRLMAEKPDLVLLPGDYLAAEAGAQVQALVPAFQALLREAGLRAPLGAYAVEGDCESRDPGWARLFEGTQVRPLLRRQTLRLPGLCLTGLTRDESADVRLVVPACERFHVVFGHRPDFALGEVQADLLVAGHTHGGQVRLPLLGPIVTFSQVPRAWAAGVTDLGGGRTLIVSRGIGMERGLAPRLRFLCRPELLIVDLVPADSPV